MSANRLPTYFLSYGGGPWPWIEGPWRSNYDLLEASLADVPKQIGGLPKAVLMISGHWEAASFVVMSSAAPGMVYDYYGFPEHTYRIRYPAPGDPALAERVRGLIASAGLPAALDAERGYDHGAFSTMYPMYPQAEVPVVQVSLQHGYDVDRHLALGRALAPLRDEDVLIVGSGLSYHNLRAFGPAAQQPSAEFDAWLQHALALPAAEREAALRQWSQAPSARRAHPQEDHLIPLMVAVGAAADEPAVMTYHEDRFMGGVTASSFRFGAVPAAP